jgi:hypothetical protein
METKTEKYFNFPIQILDGFMINDRKVLNDIHWYSIYENSLRLYKGTAIEKFKESADFYNLTLGNYDDTLKKAKILYESLPGNSPKVGLNLSIFWDFYNNDKSEFDKICLLGFLGIKSIIGPKPYCKMTNKYWLSRMSGRSKVVKDVIELPDEFCKYNNTYQLVKIKTALRNNWGLVTYSKHTKGFYVSFKMELKELVMIAEKHRNSNKEKLYKAKELEILNEVLRILNGPRP